MSSCCAQYVAKVVALIHSRTPLVVYYSPRKFPLCCFHIASSSLLYQEKLPRCGLLLAAVASDLWPASLVCVRSAAFRFSTARSLVRLLLAEQTQRTLMKRVLKKSSREMMLPTSTPRCS